VTDPRSTYAYKVARRAFLAEHHERSGLCDKCRQPMDYRGRGKSHRRTATIEHRYPVEHYPDRAMDTAYWAVFCLSCNAKGNRNKTPPPMPPPTERPPERRW
jgi:hypothetical protein